MTLAERQGNDRLIRPVSDLRAAFRQTLNDRPFATDAIVILPEHLHCIRTLPSGDDNYPDTENLPKEKAKRGASDAYC